MEVLNERDMECGCIVVTSTFQESTEDYVTSSWSRMVRLDPCAQHEPMIEKMGFSSTE